MDTEFTLVEESFTTMVTYKSEVTIRVVSPQMFIIGFLVHIAFVAHILLGFLCMIEIKMLLHHSFLLKSSVTL